MYGFLNRPNLSGLLQSEETEASTVRRESSTNNNNSLLNNDISFGTIRHKNKHFFF